MASLSTIVAMLAVFSSGFCEEKNFLQRAGMAFTGRQYRSLLIVPNGEKFGYWTWSEMCPEKFFAVGFSLKVKTLLDRTNILLHLTNSRKSKKETEGHNRLRSKREHLKGQ